MEEAKLEVYTVVDEYETDQDQSQLRDASKDPRETLPVVLLPYIELEA